jgi:hypothetical protein
MPRPASRGMTSLLQEPSGRLPPHGSACREMATAPSSSHTLWSLRNLRTVHALARWSFGTRRFASRTAGVAWSRRCSRRDRVDRSAGRRVSTSTMCSRRAVAAARTSGSSSLRPRAVSTTSLLALPTAARNSRGAAAVRPGRFGSAQPGHPARVWRSSAQFAQ